MKVCCRTDYIHSSFSDEQFVYQIYIKRLCVCMFLEFAHKTCNSILKTFLRYSDISQHFFRLTAKCIWADKT